MHENLLAKIEVAHSDQYQEILCKTIKTAKDLTIYETLAALMEFLANTNFTEHLICDLQASVDPKEIENWLAESKKQYPHLTAEDPAADEHLFVGAFTSDHKHTQYAHLYLVYERRYLENE